MGLKKIFDVWKAVTQENPISLKKFIMRVRKDEKFRERYEAAFPYNAVHIISLMDNPNCTCIQKMMKLHHDHTEDLEKHSDSVWGDTVSIVMPRQIIGEETKIPDDGESFKRMIFSLNDMEWKFRTVSIVPTVEEDGTKFLRVFFLP